MGAFTQALKRLISEESVTLNGKTLEQGFPTGEEQTVIVKEGEEQKKRTRPGRLIVALLLFGNKLLWETTGGLREQYPIGSRQIGIPTGNRREDRIDNDANPDTSSSDSNRSPFPNDHSLTNFGHWINANIGYR